MKIRMMITIVFFSLFSASVLSQDWEWAPDFEVGDKLPAIEAPDQNGSIRNTGDLIGSKGLVLVLSRSFDWCPFCISQLQQLVEVASQFEVMGVTLATMTYDSLETLKAAEEDYSAKFPLLRDEDTKHVSAFGILNMQYQPGHRAYGIPEPGIFLISADGVIRFKFAEQDYRVRPDFSQVLEAARSL
jgi:peroxiredoxin